MAAKRGIRREFHAYAKGLAKTKRDVRKIAEVAESNAPAEDRVDDIVPCLKRILERIVYGCLEVQIPVFGRTVSTRRWQNKKARELVRMVDPKFYPSPNPDRGRPYIKIDPSVRDSDALTQEQWLTAWDFANRMQHVQNPASSRSKPDPQNALSHALKWTQRAINLLSFHTVITTDSAFFGQVTMHPPHANQDVQVEVLERVTSWSTSFSLPDGNTLKIQRQNNNGEWRDVEDLSAGVLAVIRLHGIYTQRGFFRPRETS